MKIVSHLLFKHSKDVGHMKNSLLFVHIKLTGDKTYINTHVTVELNSHYAHSNLCQSLQF